MTTTTAAHGTIAHGIPQRRYSHALDRAVARFGMSMLRWAQNRNRSRALSHEAHAVLRTIETDRASRELGAERLSAMRGF